MTAPTSIDPARFLHEQLAQAAPHLIDGCQDTARILCQRCGMNALEFIASLVKSVISWPVVALVVVVLLRTPLGELIGRVKSGELMGNKWTFGDRLGHVEETAEVALADVDLQDAAEREATSDEAASQDRGAAVTILRSWERLLSLIHISEPTRLGMI